MSTNIINKKGQYYPRPSYSNIHPLLIVGIVLFCIPFLMPITGVNMPGWLESTCTTGGVITIVIGAAMSIFNAS